MRFLTIVSLCLASYAFTDESSTREVLRNYSQDNHRVLEVYDRVIERWSEYKHQHKEWDLEKLLRALEYAAEKHEGQVRKDAEQTPYIVHPIGVSELVWDVGNIRSVNVLTAALLHDTLEDTDASADEIESLFGSRVLYTVQEVTNDPNLSGEENKQRQVDHAPTMSLDGQIVKLADRLYNVSDLKSPPPSWSNKKIDQYYSWGEKLLIALKGTNEGLELALQKQIEDHKNQNTDQNGITLGRHTVEHKSYQWDPYEGQNIDQYIFCLDDNSRWIFNWFIYERNSLKIQIGDTVDIKQVSNDQYVMTIPLDSGNTAEILFQPCHWASNCYVAVQDQ